MSNDKSIRSQRSSSRPSNVSQSLTASRTFLNGLNPMASRYQGYQQANQTLLVEEDEENRSTEEERDLEAQSPPRHHHAASSKTTNLGERSEMNVLRPNIHHEDKIHGEQSSDDEVPQSFMVEAASPSSRKGKGRDTTGSGNGARGQSSRSRGTRKDVGGLPTVAGEPLPRIGKPLAPSDTEPVWDNEHPPPRSRSTTGQSEGSTDEERQRRPKPMRGLDDYERALWNWVNVYNLDAFLQEVYSYYEGKGIYSIALSRGLNLLTVGFVIGFSTFLLGCVDYSRIRHEGNTRLQDVVVHRCVAKFSGFTLLFFILFAAFYIWQIVTFVMSIQRLVDMYNFYTHLLKIPDVDVSTISWPEVVRRIAAIREENPITALSSKNARNTNDITTAKLDAHDIANRILRQENYLIALFNKELLDLRIPLPRMLDRFMIQESGKGKMLTRALEWNLRFCLMEYLFDEHGKVRKVFLKSKNRAALIDGLRRRFVFMGILNAIFAPFIVLYLLMYSFFRYFEEYHKDPSTIGGRRYTSFAQWKFREFNELPHFFSRRLDESYPLASMYIGQFPNEKMTLIMRFVAFISGSFAAVLFLATVLDPDLFLHFEITPHRTVVFYLGLFGAVLTVARGMIPEDNRVFDPELLMTEVITYTHYMPDVWKGQLHSKKVHEEFGELFQMKVLIFVEELLSVVLTPFVLWLSLPNCAPAVVDFFREFTVHVDGRGYVCSFAEFNFERHGNVKFGATTRINDKKMLSKEGKMEKSFLNFKAANPDWNPTDPSGSLYLTRMAELSAAHPYTFGRRRFTPIPGASSTEALPPAAHHNHPGVHFAEDLGAPTMGLAASTTIGAGGGSIMLDKAHEYDRALRQSQYVAASRRRGVGGGGGGLGGGSMLGMSMLAAAGGGGGPSASSIFGAMDMAKTAVLGDSRGSVKGEIEDEEEQQQRNGKKKKGKEEEEEEIPLDDFEMDGGVVGLGESYVDGAKRSRPSGEPEEPEEDGMEDGGVLKLLAQIYGRRDGQAGVM